MMSHCSPTKIKIKNCFDKKSLIAIAEEFNKYQTLCESHDVCINISPIQNINDISEEKLFNTLKKKLSKLCANEYCWADLDFINNIKDKKIRDDIKFFTFKPQPTNDSRGWLNTNNINQVINQYVKLKKFKTFIYLGAQPSDIHKVVKIDFTELKNKYKDVAIVFNNDTSKQEGSHWVSCWISNSQKKIEYFDSLGKAPNKYIKGFLKHFKGYQLVINKIEHQNKGVNCGVYACYFIIQKLHGKTFNEINSRVITDEIMQKYRNTLFLPKKLTN